MISASRACFSCRTALAAMVEHHTLLYADLADPLALLRTRPLVRYDRSLAGGRLADRYLRAQGIAPLERMELNSVLAVAMMVDQGLGVGLVPAALQDKVPPKAPATAHDWPTRQLNRKVALLLGCVQPAMMPNINTATARVLDALGVQLIVAPKAGCCGAVRHSGWPTMYAMLAALHLRRNCRPARWQRMW